MNDHDRRKIAVETQHRAQSDLRNLFRKLFEERHLYQSVIYEPEALSVIDDCESEKESVEEEKRVIRYWIDSASWYIHDQSQPTRYSGIEGNSIIVKLTHSMLYCRKCMRKEAHNVSKGEVMYDSGDHMRSEVKTKTQVFVVTLLCQSCREEVSALLVRRDGGKLTLSGRSPMEYIQVPDYIPKKIKQYYSDAVLAFQSGQMLPAIFMLRTLIEQWVYYKAKRQSTVDVALDGYMSYLPGDFKQRFPSLREQYATLSDSMHKAYGESEIFLTTLAEIDKHFKAIALYEM
jgi:hypothetical protein